MPSLVRWKGLSFFFFVKNFFESEKRKKSRKILKENSPIPKRNSQSNKSSHFVLRYNISSQTLGFQQYLKKNQFFNLFFVFHSSSLLAEESNSILRI